jgi:hypothetical protein
MSCRFGTAHPADSFNGTQGVRDGPSSLCCCSSGGCARRVHGEAGSCPGYRRGVSAIHRIDHCNYEYAGWFFDEVGTLTSNSTEADYVDEEWRLDVLGPFSIASTAQEVIATLVPPSLLAEAHGYLAESVDHLVIAGEYMRDGVLNLNVESINLAVESMLRANDLIDQANEAMPQLST